MTKELSPCPFCGSEDVSLIDQLVVASVSCAVCGTDGPIALTAAEAETVWNRRAIPPLIGLPVIDPKMLEVGK